MSDPLIDAANAISDASPKIKAFAQLAAQRIIALEHSTPAPAPTPARWFTDASYLNTPVGQAPTIDPNSAAMIKTLAAAVNGLGVNGLAGMQGQWSTTVYRSDASTPTVTITETRTGKQWTFPCAAGWKPTPDSDAHMAVIQPDGLAWEFQALNLTMRTAQGVSTGVNVLTGDGASPSVWISDLPTVVGLIRPEEIAAGVIPHALRCVMPATSSAYRWPASHSDGHTPNGVPVGAHLWLPRSVSLAGLDQYAAMIATAMQTYGLYVGDTGGAFAVYAQSTADGVTKYPFSSLALPQALVSQLVVLA